MQQNSLLFFQPENQMKNNQNSLLSFQPSDAMVAPTRQGFRSLLSRMDQRDKQGTDVFPALAIGSGFAPSAGISDVLGFAPDPFNKGQTLPSFSENIDQGRYLDAGLQTLGAGGDVLLASAPFAPFLLAPAVAMKATSQLGKAFRGGSKASKQEIPLDSAIKRFQQGSAKTKDYDEFVTTQGEYIQKEMQKAFDFSKNIPDPKNKRNYLDKTIREIENELTNRFSRSKATKTKDNVVELDFQKKKIEAELNKKDAPRDTSSGHAADGVPTQFGPPAHDMNLRISEEFTPEGFGTFSTDVGNNYENLKFFISSSRGTPQFKEEVDFYRKLFAIRGKPNAEITVYRASPTDDLRPGDLITPIKSDAQFLVDESKITQSDIIKSQRQARKDSDTIDLREEKNLRTMEDLMGMLPIKENTPSKLFEYKVKAKDIRWDGNNGLIRWGYFPDKS